MKKNYSPGSLTMAIFIALTLSSLNFFAQVGIGNSDPDASSLLDIRTLGNDKGILIPRVDIVNLATAAPVSGPITSLLVYNKNATTGPGFFYWNGTRWVGIDSEKDWKLRGNSGTTAGTDFLGTTDNVALRFKTNNFDRFEMTTDGRLRAFATGSAAAPMYSWSSVTTMGMYGIGTNILGLSTNSTERMRFLANGQVTINTAAPLSENRFTVQGATNEFAINGLTSGVGVAGIYGENNTGNGIGVFGNVGVGFGVVGQSTGVGQGVRGSNTGSGRGVIGFSESTGTGVQGQNSGTGAGVAGFSENDGVGVYGTNTGNGDGTVGMVSGTGSGVYGQNTGAAYGVHGLSNYATGFAIKASHINSLGTGLLATGNNIAGTYLVSGTGIASNGVDGAFAYGKSTTGTGLIGTGNNSTHIVTNEFGGGIAGSGTINGVFGYAGNGSRIPANTGNAAGIFTLDTDNNVLNNAQNNNNGIRARAIIASFNNIAFNDEDRGSYVAKDSYFGGYFSGGLEKNSYLGGPAIGSVSYAYVGLRYNITNNNATAGTDFKIVGPGTMSTLINDDQNVPRIMFAPEAPEILFQDYGIGQLINGQANITLDPILKRSLHIDSEHPLKVFVTLEGDCNGIYVTNKSADGFTVKELQNGNSNVSFSWQIVANRADRKDENGNVISKHVGLRLPVGPGPIFSHGKQMELMTDKNENSLKEPIKGDVDEFKGRKLASSVPIDGNESMVESQSPSQENVSTVKKQF